MEEWLAELESEIMTPTLAPSSFDIQYQPLDLSFEQPFSVDDFECFSFDSSRRNDHQQEDYNNNIITNHDNNVIVYNNNVILATNTKFDNTLNIMNNDHQHHHQKREKDIKKRSKSEDKKRKRNPSKVQDHIIAERKRRESLAQMFISLSRIVPDLKKVDKNSILGETIKYMKQLQEKVNILEESAAKQTVETSVMVKKCQLILHSDGNIHENDSFFEGDYNRIDRSDDHGSGTDNDESNLNRSLPQIQYKILNKTILLKLCCKNHKGILAKLFAEIETHDIRVVNCTTIPLHTFALDITILARMGRSFNKNVKDLVKNLRIAILSSTQ